MERWLWGGVGLLALAVASLFAYKYWQPQAELPVVSAALSSCDVQQGACSTVIEGLGAVALTIAPRPIPLVEPLTIRVETKIPAVRKLDVDFSGVDMNMGYNRFTLQPVADGLYEGSGMLPVCMRSRMIWEAKVMLTMGDVVYVAPFRFVTTSRY